MKLKWDAERFGTGVESVDNQHRELFQLYNLLDDALSRRKGKKVIGDVLLGLKEYTVMHFQSEEECMDRLGCRVAEQNKLQHAQFLQMLEEAEAKLDSIGASNFMASSLYKALGEWITGHIERCDCVLREVSNTPASSTTKDV